MSTLRLGCSLFYERLGTMVKKVHLLILVAIMLLCLNAGEGFAGEIEQIKSEIISLLQAGNYAEANTQTQKLIDDFAETWHLGEVIHEIAQQYQDSEKYDNPLVKMKEKATQLK